MTWTPDDLREVDIQHGYWEDEEVTVYACAKAWEEQTESLEDRIEELEEENEQLRAEVEKLKQVAAKKLKNGQIVQRTARKQSKYGCHSCGLPITVETEYLQKSEYDPSSRRWMYQSWHVRCPTARSPSVGTR